jgi:NADPH:quinone reductase-like Zn-dependent oxidoreductase
VGLGVPPLRLERDRSPFLGASVNPVDNAIAAGMLREMVDHDFPVVLGRDYAGTVEAIGADVDGIAVGDEVLPSSCTRIPPCMREAGRS